jgi:Fic family protein
MPVFNHYDLTLLNPAFDSPLVDVLTELEHLRRLQLSGTTPPEVFFQLKQIFHMLESLGSARIEGNHTTLADYVESKLSGSQQTPSDQLAEMENIETAMTYIEDSINAGDSLTEYFIRELHAIAVKGLVREGDDTPAAYRLKPVQISQSEHLPPPAFKVADYMEELVGFLNENHAPKYDLIKVALAHHRFGWIHPFGNGNGRVVRLLTYSLLIKYGFNVKTGGRVLNPTAVFCNDRDKYYAMLSCADKGTNENLEQWCIYVLQGILEELQKVDQLTDFKFLRDKILTPALTFARERELITAMEEKILHIAASKGIVKIADLTIAMPDMTAAQRTYQMKKLVERNMLQPIKEGARQYSIGFSNSYLMRGVIRALSNEGFISSALDNVHEKY